MSTKNPIPAPWHFRLAKALIRRGWRGPGLWIRLSHALGLLNRRARYRLSRDVTIDVPLSRPECWWDEVEVRQYEAALIETVASALSARPRPWRLVDCGADIGLFSALLTARAGPLEEVIAFEPNEPAYRLLRGNVSRLPGGGTAWLAGVSDFRGSGRLEAPDVERSEHARFLVPAAEGTMPVVTLDDLELAAPGTLVLKLDIEGGELAALRGAAATLRRAANWIVVFEAHRDVAARTGIDPVECLRLIQAIRPCTTHVAECAGIEVTAERPFFDQLIDAKIVNVVCTSADSACPIDG